MTNIFGLGKEINPNLSLVLSQILYYNPKSTTLSTNLLIYYITVFELFQNNVNMRYTKNILVERKWSFIHQKGEVFEKKKEKPSNLVPKTKQSNFNLIRQHEQKV